MSIRYENMKSRHASLVFTVGIVAPPLESRAYEFYNQDGQKLNAQIDAIFSAFCSGESYAALGMMDSGPSIWREGFIKYGLNESRKLRNHSRLYDAISLLSSGTWGDGDAAGFTEGTERRTAVEDSYLGWGSGSIFPSFGENVIVVSVSRQDIIVADEFLIKGDALNSGYVDLDYKFDRGGAYYSAPRKQCDRTAMLGIGGEKGWRGNLMWLNSDNRVQVEKKLGISTLRHVAAESTLGLPYIKGLDVNERYIPPFQLERDDMQTVSPGGGSSLGVEILNLVVEYATQNRDSGRENAWYIEGGWTFASVQWSPKATHRFSRFSESFDSLFYGNSRGYGAWFQGKVTSNYARTFNSNTRTHHFGSKINPREDLTIGALYFDLDPVDHSLANLGGCEFDGYTKVAVTDHVSSVRYLGCISQKKAASQRGLPLDSEDINTYVQLIVGTSF